MKKLVPWLFASAAVMLMLPALAVRFVNADSGMAVCLALFFLADPLFSACIGVYAGRDPQRLWSLPIFPAVFFLLGAWLFLDAGETAFLIYAAAYALLGYAAMLISRFIRKTEVPAGIPAGTSAYQFLLSGKMILLTKKKITIEIPPFSTVVPML